MTPQETLQDWVNQSRRIVFFGGAGVSTESGIPDFRSVDGLYRQQYRYPPETILSRSFFEDNPEEFFRFYRAKMLAPQAKPNAAHRKLAELEQAGRLSAVITQNIDGLHQLAGSEKVWELHGSVYRNFCQTCGKSHPLETILNAQGVPMCGCGGRIKPDVVLYEESLNQRTLRDAVNAIEQADLLLVGGTSLAVYPASGLVDYYRGNHLALLNKSVTPLDSRADLILRDPIGQVLGALQVNPL